MHNRAETINEMYRKRYKLGIKSKWTIEKTMLDLRRDVSEEVIFSLYLNHEKLSDPANLAKMVDHLEIDQRLKDYILNNSHQDGFLQVSERSLRDFLFAERGVLPTTKNWHIEFLIDSDKQLTYVEEFDIVDFIKPSGEKEDSRIRNKNREEVPIIHVKTTSTISINQKGEIQQKFSNEKILLKQKIGEQLINPKMDKSKGVKIEKEYGVGAFIKRNWGKIVVGAALGAAIGGVLVVAGIFTFGAVPAVVGIIGIKVAIGIGIALAVKSAMIAGGAVVGGATGAAISAYAAHKKEQNRESTARIRRGFGKSTEKRMKQDPVYTASVDIETPKDDKGKERIMGEKEPTVSSTPEQHISKIKAKR